MTEGPYRDGHLHVQAERCSTCVFRPGNRMGLAPGRLRQLVEDNVAVDSALTCHATLPEWPGDALPAVCRGFWDHPRATESLTVRLAKHLMPADFVVYQELPEVDAAPPGD